MADDPSGNVYEKVVGTPLSSGALPPARVSAAVVLWRRLEGGGPDDVEVFWVKRAETLAFMGGWHAFPGGGLSRSDAAPAGLGRAPARVGRSRRPRGSRSRCAISTSRARTCCRGSPPAPCASCSRRRGSCSPPPPSTPRSCPSCAARCWPASAPSRDILKGLEVKLDASPLVYAGRWVTPPFAPVRFDNRFFLLEWPPDARGRSRPSSKGSSSTARGSSPPRPGRRGTAATCWPRRRSSTSWRS